MLTLFKRPIHNPGDPGDTECTASSVGWVRAGPAKANQIHEPEGLTA